MKQRGRRSAAALATGFVDFGQQQLDPPDCLAPDERRRFIGLVGACDPQHFRASDLPLLCRYVEADALAERAEMELQATGPVVDGKASGRPGVGRAFNAAPPIAAKPNRSKNNGPPVKRAGSFTG